MTGKSREPARQSSLWECVASAFSLVAGLSVPLEALAARLRLEVETSWEEGLGEVKAAVFNIGKLDFALSRHLHSPRPDVHVWVARDQSDVDEALDVLFTALGIGQTH